MAHVRWHQRPGLGRSTLLVAFEGWNDAGDAASGALAHLADLWDAQPLAEVDPEEFYDFTSTRPEVRLDGHHRRIDWPANRFSWCTVAPRRGLDDDLEVVLLQGVEPHLRWRTFCQEVIEVAQATGARSVVTLGALLAEVPHTRPVPVYGTTSDPEADARLGLEPSRYEGPTGIVGVLASACAEAGLRSVSLWAAVPTYVSGAPSPKATLALVERVAAVLGVAVPTAGLDIAAASYERQIDELVEDDDETSAYVRHLEEQHDAEHRPADGLQLDLDLDLAEASSEELVEEVERYLRDQ